MAANKIILLDNRDLARELNSENLKVYTGLEVVQEGNIADVFDLINSKNSEIKCVVTRKNNGDQDTAKQLENFIKKKGFNLPLFVLGKYKSSREETTSIEEPYTVRDILHNVASYFEITPEEMSEKRVNEYYSYPIQLIHPGVKTPVDLYQNRDNEYEIILGKDKVLHTEVIEILQTQNINYLYVKANDRLKFINKLSDYLISTLEFEGLEPIERLICSGKSFRHIQTIVSSVGVDEKVQELCHQNINSMQDCISGIKELNGLLQNLLSEDLGYKYQHSILTLYFCSFLIKKLEWGNKDQENILAYAAFFHDIFLTEDYWAEMKTDFDVERDKALSLKDKKRIREHALTASNLLAQFQQVPIGASLVIKRHHGSNSGVGFTMQTSNLSHLDIVFIASERWADCILKAHKVKKPIKENDIFKILSSLYKINKFKKAINALNELKLS